MPKSILITGAGSGLGKDAAKALLAAGHRVYATTYTADEVAPLQAELAEIGPGAHVFKMDITSAEDRAQIAEYDIDVLINNAALSQSGSLAEVDINAVRQLFEVNLFSALELTQIAIGRMIDRGKGGTVIFISSITGRIPAPFMMPYSMSKFAISAAAAGLREEMKALDAGIYVTVVEPGPVYTGFNQKLAQSQADVLAKSSLFSSDQAARINSGTMKTLEKFEVRSTRSVTDKIVKAATAAAPKLRYVAPLHFAIAVRLLRMLGV